MTHILAIKFVNRLVLACYYSYSCTKSGKVFSIVLDCTHNLLLKAAEQRSRHNESEMFKESFYSSDLEILSSGSPITKPQNEETKRMRDLLSALYPYACLP